LLARALPLIALLVTFLFLTTEVWQTAGTLGGPPYWIALALFPVVGTLFIPARLPREVDELNNFEGWAEIGPLVEATPVALVLGAALPIDDVRTLDTREWRNVRLWLTRRRPRRGLRRHMPTCSRP
jgi:hypothetical protein